MPLPNWRKWYAIRKGSYFCVEQGNSPLGCSPSPKSHALSERRVSARTPPRHWSGQRSSTRKQRINLLLRLNGDEEVPTTPTTSPRPTCLRPMPAASRPSKNIVAGCSGQQFLG